MKKTAPLFVFTLIFLIIWVGLTYLIHSPTSISPDTAENIMWGMNNYDLIEDKHPGLGALFLKPFVAVFSPLAANLIAVTICILITWFFIYKISKIFFEHKEAIFVTLLTVLSFFYMAEFFIQYNQNIILLPFWLGASYFFIKSIETNKTLYWLLTATALAIGVYAKFQIELIAICMALFLILNYKRQYTKNIIYAAILGIILVIPCIMALYNIDFLTIKYASARIDESNQSYLYSILYALFDIFFQLLNFSVAIVILIYLKKKGKISKASVIKSDYRKAFLFVALGPYIIFFVLEAIKGMLPPEWLVCTTTLVLPALYLLLKIKISNINLYKIVLFGIAVNLVYFISFNYNTYTNTNIEHNNIGNSVAIAADQFIKDNHLEYPKYVSGIWNYSLYLSVFMEKHPEFIRKWYKLKHKGQMLLIYPGCNNNLYLKEVGFELIYQQCRQVKLIDKLKPQYKTFEYTLVEKNNLKNY